MQRVAGYGPVAETVARNIDILSKILLRVTAKSLLKFKCVSKQWLTLISDPQCCRSHTLRQILMLSPTPFSSTTITDPLFTSNSVSLVVCVPYFDYLNVPRVTFLQSCNGLLLCSFGFLVTNNDHSFRYFVCNPTTKQFTVVNLPDREVRDRLITLNLAFEPSRSPHYRVISISSGISGVIDDKL
ncbi:hypothetical protein QN277_024099 [Acacia crassicarpa]|uniref:F-box domain-containing protein n=1 Tax=Acacia crassicarpa TaxID=499986 RepID=A0AAE1JE14_9FABA|nr:hypothetical protein QN277_024099 [Acacia crassicarpa]